MAKKKSEKLDISRRFFMKKATAVVGGVATTAVTATGVSKAIGKATDSMADHSEKYRADDRHQGQLMAKKKFVEMSSTETDQMLDVIIKHHQKIVS